MAIPSINVLSVLLSGFEKDSLFYKFQHHSSVWPKRSFLYAELF